MRTTLAMLLILVPSSALACESTGTIDHINRTTEVIQCPENLIPKIIGDRVPLAPSPQLIQETATTPTAEPPKQPAAETTRATASKKKLTAKRTKKTSCKKGQRRIKHWRGKRVWYTCA